MNVYRWKVTSTGRTNASQQLEKLLNTAMGEVFAVLPRGDREVLVVQRTSITATKPDKIQWFKKEEQEQS